MRSPHKYHSKFRLCCPIIGAQSFSNSLGSSCVETFDIRGCYEWDDPEKPEWKRKRVTGNVTIKENHV
jgi:hypothetical protein